MGERWSGTEGNCPGNGSSAAVDSAKRGCRNVHILVARALLGLFLPLQEKVQSPEREHVYTHTKCTHDGYAHAHAKGVTHAS